MNVRHDAELNAFQVASRDSFPMYSARIWIYEESKSHSLPLTVSVCNNAAVSKPTASNSHINSSLMRARLGLPNAITALIILRVLGGRIWSDLPRKHAEVLEVHKILKELSLFRGWRLNELSSLWVAWRQWRGYKALRKEIMSPRTQNKKKRSCNSNWAVGAGEEEEEGAAAEDDEGPRRRGETRDQHRQRNRQSIRRWHLDKVHLMPFPERNLWETMSCKMLYCSANWRLRQSCQVCVTKPA